MNDAEFRALDPADHEEFARITDYAFHPADGPRAADEEPPDRIADRFGLFVDGELASVCAHYDFSARLRGEWVPLAGLAAVATPPEHRRQGYVSRIVEESLDRWRGEYPIAALWPFDRAYYEQFGWATANEVREYGCPPDALAFARGRSEATLRRVRPEEWERLQSAHERHAASRELTLRRDGDWWREKVFRVDDDDRPFVYAVERDDGPVGHVAYSFSDGDGHGADTLTVADLAFADDEALLAILEFLADHDSQAADVRLVCEADSGLLDRFRDPSAADCTVKQGPMARLVDVADALSTVSYPADASADVTLAVSDDTAPWNDAVFRLRVADGAGRCERVTDGSLDAPADLTVDIGTLSQLVVGYHGVDAARQLGALSVDDEAVADALAALFPSRTVFLRDFF